MMKYFAKNVSKIACTLFCKVSNVQIAQNIFEILALGDALGLYVYAQQSLGTLYHLDIFSENVEKNFILFNISVLKRSRNLKVERL